MRRVFLLPAAISLAVSAWGGDSAGATTRRGDGPDTVKEV